jgi:site-specific recombinase XerD
VEKIPRPKTEHKLPIVLSTTEVKSIIEAPANLKHKTILMALYSTGCRLSEVTHLKVTDIDSKRMQVRVEQGKGKKDRYTLLSETLLITLRDYWRKYIPKTWLFFGYDKDNPLTVTSIQRAFKDAKKKLA